MRFSRLSIFVDESGDFGFKQRSSDYYLFTMVFHDQDDNISQSLSHLEQQLSYRGFENHCIHTAPLIRKEGDYRYLDMRERRDLLYAMRRFSRKVCVRTHTFIFNKQHAKTKEALQARIAKELGIFLRDNLAFFQHYDSIVLYYDNGQSELGTILNAVCNTLLDVEIKKEVKPSNYRLFQLADYVCTLELLSIKASHNSLSKNEKRFFKSQELKKQFLKEIRKLEF